MSTGRKEVRPLPRRSILPFSGKTVFKSNNFAGYVGIYNGLRPQVANKPNSGWTISCNDRFMAEGGYVGLYRWLSGMDPNGKFMSWLARENLEYVDSQCRPFVPHS